MLTFLSCSINNHFPLKILYSSSCFILTRPHPVKNTKLLVYPSLNGTLAIQEAPKFLHQTQLSRFVTIKPGHFRRSKSRILISMRPHRKPSLALAYIRISRQDLAAGHVLALTETASSRIRATFDCLLRPKQTRVSCSVYTRDLWVLEPLRSTCGAVF